MSRETRWWWIRHAPVTEHSGKIYGQGDLPADFRGTDTTIRGLANVLPMDGIAIVSDLIRAVATAEAHQEPDFREQDFGDWQGLSHEELSASCKELNYRRWLAPAFERPPNGESYSDVVGRVVPAIIHHTSISAGKDIIAVAHAGSIRAAISYALGLDPETSLSFSIENLSLTRLDYIETDSNMGTWRINCINRTFCSAPY
jgi:alpha-ribazole phosphatase